MEILLDQLDLWIDNHFRSNVAPINRQHAHDYC